MSSPIGGADAMKPYYESCGVTILNGDCRTVMAAMEPNSVDSIVCDPPYDLTSGKKGGSGAASLNVNSPAGRSRISTGGFMGAVWDATGVAFDPATWAEALRVLKPGGYLLAFSGTRTSHRMVCAIEDAGFEVKDSIIWLYASGFPKSHNLSKAFDKAAGAERDVVGVSPHAANRAADMGFHGGSENEGLRFITAPATDLAKQWDGWGSALSPSHEPICMARKPLSEPTIIANVAKWGTGGINVDACRIPGSMDGTWGATQKSSIGYGGTEVTEYKTQQHALGRWPKNTILGCCGNDPHDEDCPVAVLDAQSKGASKFFKVVQYDLNDQAKGGDDWAEQERHQNIRVVSDTPPRRGITDSLSGTQLLEKGEPLWRTSSSGNPTTGQSLTDTNSTIGTEINKITLSAISNSLIQPPTNDCTPAVNCAMEYGGSHAEPAGSSSRLTPPIGISATRAGQVTGGAGPVTSAESLPISNDGGRFAYVPKASKRERNLGLPKGESSNHPTVKPVALMRHLVKLVTPPGGVVLDPFTGSGSTGVAAQREGFRFIGIEQSPEYAAIAAKRISNDAPLFAVQAAPEREPALAGALP